MPLKKNKTKQNKTSHKLKTIKNYEKYLNKNLENHNITEPSSTNWAKHLAGEKKTIRIIKEYRLKRKIKL